MNFKIRTANSSELGWINQKYDEIGFQHAKSKDIIAIAELENMEKVGLGRLVRLNEKSLELAVIYIFEPYRNKGVARKISEFFMMYCKQNEIIYCLPFSEIKSLYKKCGFVDCTVDKNVPKPILDKCEWCWKSHKAFVDVLIFNQF